MSGAQEAFPGSVVIEPSGPGWLLFVSSPQGDRSGQRVIGTLFCRDRGVLQTIADAVALSRRAQGPLLSAADFTRLYFPHGGEAHLDHPAAPGIFCDPDADTGSMFGTGTQEEREWAASLPLCGDCRRWSRAIRVLR